MKIVKLIAAAVVAVSAYSASAQSGGGQLSFSTFNTAVGVNEIFDVGGTTGIGANFDAEIYTSPTGTAGSFVAAGGIASPNAAFPGYITAQNLVTSPNVAVGVVGFYEVKVWNASAGSTFEQASTVVGAHIGVSTPQQNGQFGGNPTTGTPITPPFVNNFANFTLTTVTAVPEPSTIALGIVGVAGLLALRRRQ